MPSGGGYTAEIVLADAEVALAEIGTATLVGEVSGPMWRSCWPVPGPNRCAARCSAMDLALPVAPSRRRRRVSWPLAASSHPPDPYALFELSRDLRPRDYATLFVRMAVELSGLDEPIAVPAVVRPPWLAAVVDEVGVTTCSLADALAMYAPPTL